MIPKLIALAGPLRGATCELSAKEFYIGRDPHSQLCLDDRLVSRQHALITRKDDRFEISDLKSANGTMVNGVPVSQRRLAHCDQIAIGTSLLLFLLGEDEAALQAGPVRLDDGQTTTGVSTLLQAEDALYLHVEKALAAMPHSERIARDLSKLLKISLAINSIRQTKELLPRLLELIFEVIPAEQGAILLVDERGEGTTLPLSASLDRELGRDQQILVSRTVVERAMREQAALLGEDVQESATLGPTLSLLASQTRSLLAASLAVFEQPLGVVYLTTRDPEVRFNQDHQELLTAIASIAAVTLQNIRRVERLEDELRRQRAEMREMIGESKPMRQLNRLIAKAAPSDSTVLIRGESGTGKELAARAIHRGSPRARKPFVAINCAALPEQLAESELFGHERGAFTGAINQKRGLLEAADGGTMFLDEIGEMPLALQAKLLRALQEREFLRVGGTRPIKVNVRVIAATNRDLEAMAKDGRFREDLYYRLNVFPLTLPPLRERREDIVLLARYFLHQFAEACKRSVRGFSQPALNCLLRYDWPGNVRELANAVERAVVLCDGEFIHPFDLPEAFRELDAPTEAAGLHLPTALKETKKQLILQAVEQARGNLTAAAKLLGVDAANFHRLIRELDLKPEVEKLIHSLKVKSDPKP
ncbi:MAG: sigma 54-interacting transcriptional regulator [Acidobacteria bacterium]|nr:sigma 54-interacting transcriptional regulator [Acidobacteriota bacterium]